MSADCDRDSAMDYSYTWWAVEVVCEEAALEEKTNRCLEGSLLTFEVCIVWSVRASVRQDCRRIHDVVDEAESILGVCKQPRLQPRTCWSACAVTQPRSSPAMVWSGIGFVILRK